jgi:hypothetical protein
LRPLFFAFLLGSAGAGLGAKVDDTAACPGSCELEVGYSLDPRFAADERLVIAEAARTWERGSGGRVCFREGGDDVRFIRLNEQRDLEPEDPDWQRHVALCKTGRIWLVPSKVDDRSEYVALVIHELGHHLGLAHIEDAPMTYMHSTINDTPMSLRATPQIPERDRREFCKVHRCTCSW